MEYSLLWCSFCLIQVNLVHREQPIKANLAVITAPAVKSASPHVNLRLFKCKSIRHNRSMPQLCAHNVRDLVSKTLCRAKFNYAALRSQYAVLRYQLTCEVSWYCLVALYGCVDSPAWRFYMPGCFKMSYENEKWFPGMYAKHIQVGLSLKHTNAFGVFWKL